MKRQYIVVIIITTIIGLIARFELSNHIDRNQSEEKNDLEIVRNWFPNLSDIQSVQLYTQKLGVNNSIIPGPSTVYAEGIIGISKENSEKYFVSYGDWEDAEIGQLHSELELPDCEWFYSKNFEAEIKPSYYYGKIFLGEAGYLFFYMTIE